jgi:hypothetical protein
MKPAGVLMAFVLVIFLAILARPDGSSQRRKPAPTRTRTPTATARAHAAPPAQPVAPALVANEATTPAQDGAIDTTVIVLGGLAVCLSGLAVVSLARR